MSQENVDRAREFLDAYNRRDFDAAFALCDPEVDFVLPARQSSDSGRGTEEISRFWEGLDETMEELTLEQREFFDGGDRVATRLRYFGRGRESGVEVETEMYHQVITFSDGRMVRIEYFGSWPEALKAAGGSE
ncbi:MAG: nuclear transport factor 2 family protein [Solirubrobacterales bacterium]